ncbi:hypothetical protein PVK06_002517 [Gossypium arboreum]|uniref:RNase H type-1 domain-containing protein n=1 Tax=Gossypium arboreum TaxID=29729 RepID=A0ABR0R3T0_GOSAR|nr:hypothetical protein PVK06_002517 [Gossypium arboreum]
MLADWAEVFAFEESLKIAFSINISKVIFGTDRANLVSRVKKRGKDITMMGYQIGKACKYMENFNPVVVIWANCNYNKVADLHCKQAIKNSCNWTFDMDYRKDILDFVISDSMDGV